MDILIAEHENFNILHFWHPGEQMAQLGLTPSWLVTGE